MTPAADAVETLADEMADRWRRGDRPPAEEFFARHPDLWDRTADALELIAEELALREEHGVPATAAELLARFPRWAAEVQALLDCQRALGPTTPAFPAPGDVLDDFRLRAELLSSTLGS